RGWPARLLGGSCAVPLECSDTANHVCAIDGKRTGQLALPLVTPRTGPGRFTHPFQCQCRSNPLPSARTGGVQLLSCCSGGRFVGRVAPWAPFTGGSAVPSTERRVGR